MTHKLPKAHPFTPLPIGVSLTVPDQSMSCRKILDRQTKGLRIPDAMLNGTYDENDDVLNLNGRIFQMMSLEEKMQLIKDNRTKTNEMTRAYQLEERKNRSKQETEIFNKKLDEAVKKALNEPSKA